MSANSIQRLSAALAIVPLMLPATASSVKASDRSPTSNATSARPQTDFRPIDIQLQTANILAGRVVDAYGAIVPNAEILVTQASREIARATADESGEFRMTLPKGGIYLVKSGDSLQLIRAWTTTAAPPNSRGHLLLAPPTVIVRGQNGGGSFMVMSNGVAAAVGLTVAAGVATAIAVPLALNSNTHHNSPSMPPNNQTDLRPASP